MSDIDARFQEFHAEHPEVLVDLERLAQAALAKGCKRLGVKCLWEVLRYERGLAGNPLSMPNELTSRFARVLIERNPRLQAVIETRTLKSGEPQSAMQDFIDWFAV